MSWIAEGDISSQAVCLLSSLVDASWACTDFEAAVRSATLTPLPAGTYTMRLVATSRAGLKNHVEVLLTVDASAPLPGAVHTGESGALSWGASDRVKLSWDSAVDQESGIVAYEAILINASGAANPSSACSATTSSS